VELRREDGRPLELPPTNYLAAGERVPAGEGVRFRASACAPAPAGGFLELRHLVDRATGRVRAIEAQQVLRAAHALGLLRPGPADPR
jgi:hypothetical protein